MFSVRFPDGHTEQWNQNDYEQYKDDLYKDFQDAKVTRVSTYMPDNDTDASPSDQFHISFSDGHSEVWRRADFDTYKGDLMKDDPKAQIIKASDMSEQYWRPKADEALQNLRVLGEQNDDFMRQYEGNRRLAEAMENSDGIDDSEYHDFVAANRDKYDELYKRREDIRKQYFNNPVVKEDFAKAAATAASLNEDFKARADASDNREERNNWKRAAKLQDDIRKMYEAPNKYVEELDGDNGFLKYLSDYGSGIVDKFTDKDFYTLGLSKIARNFDLRGIAEKLENAPEGADIDTLLSPGEKAQIMSFYRLADAQKDRANSISSAYNAGGTFAESLKFMAEFLLSQGLANVAGKALSGSSNALASWIGRQLMSERALNRAVSKGVTSLTKGTKAALLAEEYLAKPIIQGLWHTATQVSSLEGISEGLMDTNDNGKLVSVGQAVTRGLVDQLVENWSESFGGAIEKTMALPFKGLGWAGEHTIGNTSFGRWARWLYNSAPTQILKEAGFNGMLSEIGEEWAGNAVRVGLGLMSKDDFKDFASWQQQLEMAASFAPLSLFGLGTASMAAARNSNNYKKLSGKVKGILERQGRSEEEINDLFNTRFDTPEDVGKKLAPYLKAVSEKAQTEGATKQDEDDYRTITQFAEALGIQIVTDEVHKLEQADKRQKVRSDIEGTVGQFWQVKPSEEGAAEAGQAPEETVRVVTDADGAMYYVLSEDASGKLGAVTLDGKPTFLDQDKLSSDQTYSMEEYLQRQSDMLDKDQEQRRMAQDRLDQVNAVKQEVAANPVIPIGTEAKPINASVVAVSNNGVHVVYEEDGQQQERDMSWNEVAEYLGHPIVVKTDAELEQEEANALDEARTRLEGYKKVIPGAEMTVMLDTGEDGEMRPAKVKFEKAVLEDGIIMLYGQDENGESAPYSEDMVANIPELLKEVPVEEGNPFKAGTSVSFTDENGTTFSGMVTEADNGGGFTTVELPDGSTSNVRTEQLSIMDEEEETQEPAVNKYLKDDGTVNQTAFLNKEPEEWAKWNDQRRNDNGVGTKRVLNASIKELDKQITKKTTELNNEPNPDEQDKKEEALNELVNTRNRLAAILEGYVAKDIAAEEEAKRVAEQKEREAAADAEPQDIFQLAAKVFETLQAQGKLKNGLNRESFRKETGLGNTELAKFFSLWARKGKGLTVDQLVQMMIELDGQYGFIPMDANAEIKDSNAAKNAIIEVFRSASTPSDLLNMTASENRERRERANAEAEDVALNAFVEAYGVLPDEYAQIEEARKRDIEQLDSPDAENNDNFSIFTALYYDYAANEETISGGAADAAEGGDSVLPGERTDNAGALPGEEQGRSGGAVSGVPDESGAVQESAPAGPVAQEASAEEELPESSEEQPAAQEESAGEQNETPVQEEEKKPEQPVEETPAGQPTASETAMAQIDAIRAELRALRQEYEDKLAKWHETKGATVEERYNIMVENAKKKRELQDKMLPYLRQLTDKELEILAEDAPKYLLTPIEEVQKERADYLDKGRISRAIQAIQKIIKTVAKPLGKLNLYDYTDQKDVNRPALAGVYHHDGLAYASDTRIIVGDKSSYDKKNEGKLIGKDGKVIDQRYPKVKDILSGLESYQKERMDFKALRDFLASIKAQREAEWQERKDAGEEKLGSKKDYVNKAYVALNIDTDVTVEFKYDLLSKFADYAERIGAKEMLYKDDRRAVIVKTPKGICALMPVRTEWASRGNSIEEAARIKHENYGAYSYGENELMRQIARQEAEGQLSEEQKKAIAFVEGKTPEQVQADYEAKQQKAEKDAAEARRQERLIRRVEAWKKLLGDSFVVLRSRDDVDAIRDERTRKQALDAMNDSDVHGFYASWEDKAYIYLPNIQDTKQLDQKVLHEVITHKGLRHLLGTEKYNTLLDWVFFERMSPLDKKEFLGYVNGTADNAAKRRAAADEFLAHAAEHNQTISGYVDSSFWKGIATRVMEFINDMMGADFFDTEVQHTWLDDILQQSFENLAREKRKAAEKQDAKNEVVEALTEGENNKTASTVKVEKNPQVAISQTQEKYEDFGEKIGMARKDTAQKGIKKGDGDSRPAWLKKYNTINVRMRTADEMRLAQRMGSYREFEEVIHDITKGTDFSKPFVGFYEEVKKSAFGNRTIRHYIYGADRKPIVFTSQDQYEATVPVFEAKAQGYYVREVGGKFHIQRAASNGKMVDYAIFDTREQAAAYLASPEGCTELLNRKRENYELPALNELTRNGMKDYRQGKDIRPEDFQETFGFRGGEFGNWLNAEERQQFLNYAYDAFMDLAELIGVSPRALSLGGELSIAFGARGKGKAAAHYEATRAVVNLTKMNGAGSLAHEWAHALDNYFGLMDAKRERIRDEKENEHNRMYLSEGASYRWGARKEVIDAFKEVSKALQKKTVTRAIAEDTANEELEKKQKYFDRAVDREKSRLSMGRRTMKYNRKTKGYDETWFKMTPEQLEQFDKLVPELLTDTTFERTWIPEKMQLRYVGETANKMRELVKDIIPDKRDENPLDDIFRSADTLRKYMDRAKDAKEGKSETVVVDTDMKKDSMWFDRDRAGDYWTREREMFARAFEEVLAHKMGKEGKSSDYLTYLKGPIYQRNWEHSPYPQGDELATAEAAFDKLFSTIQEKEEDGKALLYSKTDKSKLPATGIEEESSLKVPVVTSSDANVIRNLDKTIEKYKNVGISRGFIADVAEALGLAQKGSSRYGRVDAVNGRSFILRLSNHNATVSNFDGNNERDGISIVVSRKPNEHITNNGDAHIEEYFYSDRVLNKADGEPLSEIAASIKQSLYIGEYEDTTGLAIYEEVNAGKETGYEDSDELQFSKAGDINSDNFKKWFGKSAAVDRDGNPLVLYHQTAGNFTVFDTSRVGAGKSDFMTPFGIFLKPTDANIGLRGNRQMPLYASIQSPLTVNDREELLDWLKNVVPGYAALEGELEMKDAEYKRRFDEADRRETDIMLDFRDQRIAGKITREENDRLLDEIRSAPGSTQEILNEWKENTDGMAVELKKLIGDFMRKNGYDGMHIRNDRGSFGRRVETWVALEPTQVKSAINNNGEYSDENPDIRFSRSQLAQDDKLHAWGFDIAPYEERFAKAKSNEEKTAILTEYLNEVKTDDLDTHVCQLSELKDWLISQGMSEEQARQVESTYDDTFFVGEYNPVIDKAFFLPERVPSFDYLRQEFVHEREHRRTIKIGKEELLTRVANAFGLKNGSTFAHNNLYDAIQEMTGNAESYVGGIREKDRRISVLANEFISYAMQRKYSDSDFANTLEKMYIAKEAIDIINELYDEGRRSYISRDRAADGQAHSGVSDASASENLGAAPEGESGEVQGRSNAQKDVSRHQIGRSERQNRIASPDDGILFSRRTKPAPEKTGIGYKVFFRGKDGKLYPPMVANPNGEDTPVGVWLDADAAPVAGQSKTGRPQVKAGGKGTQGGSGTLAYRPGWHLGEIPYALQFNRINPATGQKELFPRDFVWAEVEYAADKDYQKEAEAEGMTEGGKYRHSYAGLKRVPEDGFYRYRTNPNPETDPWIITGSMKVNRVLSDEEVDDLVRKAGREPQMREDDLRYSRESREAAANLYDSYENQNGEDKPWIAEGEQFLEMVENELPYNPDTAPIFAMIDQYRRLDAVDLEEGRRDFTGAEMSELFQSILTDLRDYSQGSEQRRETLRFSRSNENQAMFISNAAAAVDAIPMGKATPQQWLKMIESKGGLKAGEDRWIGLSDWIKSQDKKSLTKQEIVDYINEHQIQIEETHYAEVTENEYEDAILTYVEEYDELVDQGREAGENDPHGYAWDEMIDRYGDDFGMAFYQNGDSIAPEYDDFRDGFAPATKYYLEQRMPNTGVESINSTRLKYTTEGLGNKQEIALTVPTVEAWNEDDFTHFGDAGNGRAIAWARFGDAKIGKEKALFIDEIQPKRHQDAREEGGYKDLKKLEEAKERVQQMFRYYGVHNIMQLEEAITNEQHYKDLNEYKKLYKAIPAAPFEKNWHELAMKRMLRYAAENGYDYVAWTTGDQQAERYNIGNVVNSIDWDQDAFNKEQKTIHIDMVNDASYVCTVDSEGKIVSEEQGVSHISGNEGKNLSELVGKEMAVKIMSLDKGNLKGDNLRIGGEGMRGFYDDILPRFMNKYGKKWGVSTKDELVSLADGAFLEAHAVPVTPEMKSSVMNGQLMFSRSTMAANQASAGGIGSVIGEGNARDFYMDMYKAMSKELRAKVLEGAMGNGMNIRKATEEYVSDAAGRDNDDTGLLGVAKNILDGYAGTLTNEASRYILWRGDRGVDDNNPLDIARDQAMRKRMGVESPRVVPVVTPIEAARAEVDTNPTDAQKEAGNYKKGHLKLDGYDISIENPKGSVRSGKDASGKEWSVTMNNDYGYFRMTEGVDGDHIDVFLSDNPTEGDVFVVDQVKEDGSFDEHKVMYGFNSAEEASEAYFANYSPGWKGLGNITGVTKDEFKKWVESSHRKTKPFAEYESLRFSKGDLKGELGAADKATEGQIDEAQSEMDRQKKALKKDLLTAARAMSAQKEYDKTTVAAVANLAKQLLKDQEIAELKRTEVSRLLGIVRSSVGRSPKVVKKYADTIVQIVIDQLLKKERAALDALTKKTGTKTNQTGVEVQGELDVQGQNTLKAFKEALEYEVGNVDDGDDKNTLYGMRAGIQNRLSSRDDAVRREAEAEDTGLALAIEYKENIKALLDEERGLTAALKDLMADYKDGKMSRRDYEESLQATNDAIRENNIDQIEAYRNFRAKMVEMISGSKEARNAFIEQERKRVEDIHHLANSDMQGRSADPDKRPTFMDNLANSPVLRFFTAPLGTFDQMLRLFGNKSVNGEGYLYNKYMRGWLEAREKEIQGLNEAKSELDSKVSEVFGQDMKWSDLYAVEGKMPKVTVKWWGDGEKKDHELTQGQLLYIYMVNKMADGRMKLRKMGITQEHVDAIVRQMDERFLTLADWLQDEYLVNLRNKYNAVHERLFGASMAAIEDYFPLKINKRGLNRNEDIGKSDDYDALPSTTTGSIIKRRRNDKALDLLNADAFSVVIEHVEQMERWAAFAEFNKDVNALLSYKRFRNQVQNMASVYGSGTVLWNNFKDVSRIAGNAYHPIGKPHSLDSAAVNVAKGVTSAKISFRIYTALKQFLSMPAFVADANIINLATDMATPWKAWNWAMENLPVFEERWKSRIAGDTRLMDTDVDWKLYRTQLYQKLSKLGMSPNAFVDAVTVAIGAHSIYRTKYDNYIKEGFSEEEADRKAKQDATILVNETQQSTENAFLSSAQLDRTVFSTAITVFRNSSMGFQRQVHDSLRNLGKHFKQGYREQSIAYMTKQLERQGLTEEQAAAAAERRYNRSTWRDMVRLGTFGFLVEFAWNLGGSIAYLLFGDDDKEKEVMVAEAFRHALIGGSMEGLAAGNVMSDALNMIAKGENLRNYDPSLLPIISDLKHVYSMFGYDWVAATHELVNLGVQAGIGVNPQTLEDAIVGVIDACNGDMDTSREAMLLILRVMQVPQGQLDQIYIDELGTTAERAKRMSYSQMARRYADYKMNRSTGAFQGLYSDELKAKRKKSLEKRFKKQVKERKELDKK